MTSETKQVLIKRTKSFAWRLGGLCAIAILNFIADQVGLFDLPYWAVGLLGVGIGEATKYFNVNLPELKKKRLIPAGPEEAGEIPQPPQ